jgi:hypothetical protein
LSQLGDTSLVEDFSRWPPNSASTLTDGDFCPGFQDKFDHRLKTGQVSRGWKRVWTVEIRLYQNSITPAYALFQTTHQRNGLLNR